MNAELVWNVHVLTWMDRIVEDLIDGLDVLIRRSMEDDDDGANEADCAAELPQCTQFLVQEVGPEHGTDEDAQGS